MYNRFIKFIHTTIVRTCARKVIMKKTLMTICIVLVAALLCAALIACNPTTPPDDDGNDDHNQYEQAKYTVTFNVDSNDFKLTDNVIKDVLSGASVSRPKNKDGSDVVPIKTGYTFKYWSANGTDEFIFGQTPITKNTTITALYTNNTYELTPHVDKKLVAQKDADGKYTYSVIDSDNQASLGADSKLIVTYNDADNLDCPKTEKEGDEFLFWFYFDNENKPVRLTKFATSSDAAVKLENKWTLALKMDKETKKNEQFDVYAMFKSTLPKVEVVYCDSLSAATYGDPVYYPVTESITQAAADKVPAGKAGYTFAKWYYEQSVTVNDEEKVVQKDFVFKTDDTTGTTLYQACALTDYFTPATLRLYAKWTKQITIDSVTSYREVYDLLRKEDPTDSEKKQIAEILEAEITFKSIDFALGEFEPFFDSDHVFTGTIDGGVYSDDGKLTSQAVISGGKFGSTTDASVFGCVSGTVKNLTLNNVGLVVKKAENKYANLARIGYVASVLEGKVEHCTVTATTNAYGEDYTGQSWLDYGMKAVIFGGIAAEVRGDNQVKDTGMVRDCTITLGAKFFCESLTFGGVCGSSNSAATLSANTVTVTLEKAHCHDDGQTSNGRSYAKIGGIAGVNGGAISASKVAITVGDLESLDETFFGGVCADNTGRVVTTSTTAKINAKVGGAISQIVCVGGMIGRNEGYILNGYCNIDINVVAQKENGIVAVGGIAGSNFSDKTDSSSSTRTGVSAINLAYSVGSIKVSTATLQEGKKIELYVGGIAGRNNQAKKISNCFTVTDIVVENSTDGVNNIGRMFGKHEKKAEFSTASMYYAVDKKFTLNGETEFKHNEDTQGNSEGAEWFLSSENIKGKFAFDFGENGEWKIAEGQYPTLK